MKHYTSASIPDECYPNVLAQLWCYAQIDFENAGMTIPKRILLVAELWSHSKSESAEDGSKRYWVWQNHHQNFKLIPLLFRLYGGIAERKAQPNVS